MIQNHDSGYRATRKPHSITFVIVKASLQPSANELSRNSLEPCLGVRKRFRTTIVACSLLVLVRLQARTCRAILSLLRSWQLRLHRVQDLLALRLLQLRMSFPWDRTLHVRVQLSLSSSMFLNANLESHSDPFPLYQAAAGPSQPMSGKSL